ncbi:MAG: hypothetical protein EZS28_043556 [Streblomastix strix]|uniref:Uncharacterized protein n=1 Tax=Streblomastix strix TaxID=222440 RepID=A0A5J4TRN2_9EUKA|nr:MAG: hypothetical protein EZS28_043556 [Streblomastix strix]
MGIPGVIYYQDQQGGGCIGKVLNIGGGMLLPNIEEGLGGQLYIGEKEEGCCYQPNIKGGGGTIELNYGFQYQFQLFIDQKGLLLYAQLFINNLLF